MKFCVINNANSNANSNVNSKKIKLTTILHLFFIISKALYYILNLKLILSFT